MAWSRLAKKFREEEQPTTSQAAPVEKKVSKAHLKKLAAKMGAGSSTATQPAPPAPAPVAEEPAPVVDAGPPKPGKRSREAVKRPRFVYVPPPKTEKKEVTATALPAPKGGTLAAKMMTKNLALPPEEDTPPALPGQFRP